jgi:hypothetical protein
MFEPTKNDRAGLAFTPPTLQVSIQAPSYEGEFSVPEREKVPF